MSLERLMTRVHGKLCRTAATRLARRPFPMRNAFPLISFTFDDFPRSALLNGGQILEEHGIRGTYYASFGLMGQIAPTGEVFHREDLSRLIEGKHELGCHTYSHCHSWSTPADAFEQSVLRNQQALREFAPSCRFESLSYPISCPRPTTKHWASGHFAGCRAGGQTFNKGRIDLAHMQAFFIEQSLDRPEVMQEMIKAAVAAKGWLIFATHDVCDSPTRYGCTPELFQRIVGCAAQSGAHVLPVSDALREIGSLVSPGER